MASLNSVRELLNAELARIRDQSLVARIRELLVEPYAVVRDWNYGVPGEAYECWTVLEHHESNSQTPELLFAIAASVQPILGGSSS